VNDIAPGKSGIDLSCSSEEWPVVAKLPSLRRTMVISGAIALLGIDVCCAASARAQAISGPISEDVLFQTMLSKSLSLDATLRYAVSSKERGDLEASIGALERLLFFNQRLSDVRFELGMLYLRLGSYEMARGYFQSAQAGADATEEMKRRAQDYLDVIAKRLQTDQLSGYVQTGFRFQTNASLGPTQQSLSGATRPITSQFAPQSDWNWFAAFGLSYVHDFENQSGDVIEANVIGYDAQQFRVTAVNTRLLDIRAGPRFGILLDSLTGASI
jgi:tetratricopeptide (TPR) repeat protein